MTIHIIGAGAVGNTLYCHLKQKNPNVLLYGRASKNQRLAVHSSSGSLDTQIEIQPVHLFKPQDKDIAILAIKQYSVKDILPFIENSACPIITLQNGYNPELERVSSRVPGIITISASSNPAGATEHRAGKVFLGASGYDSRQIAAQLNSKKLPFQYTDNIEGCFWSKLLFNASLNALTAILGRDYGEVLANPHSRKIAIQTYLESLEIAQKNGAQFSSVTGAHPEKIAAFLRSHFNPALYFLSFALSGSKSSMQQDIAKGRTTEVDYINGFLVKKAEDAGIKCELNKTLVNLVHQLEAGKITPSPANMGLFGNEETTTLEKILVHCVDIPELLLKKIKGKETSLSKIYEEHEKRYAQLCRKIHQYGGKLPPELQAEIDSDSKLCLKFRHLAAQTKRRINNN